MAWATPEIIDQLPIPDKLKATLLGDPAHQKAREAVARGAIPMPPAALILCQAVLADIETDEAIRQEALKSLIAHPPSIVNPLSKLSLPAPALIFLLTATRPSSEFRQNLITNAATPPDVLSHMAAHDADESVLRMIADNQMRMIANPEIAEAFLGNMAVNVVLRAKVEEFFARTLASKIMLQTGVATEAELRANGHIDDSNAELVKAAAAEHDGIDIPADLLHETSAGGDSEVEASAALKAAQQAELDAKGGTKKEEENVNASMYKRILSATVGQKIKLAMVGNKEARMLLIRDGNKVVQSLVLRNGRITMGEIVNIAQSKATSEEHLRTISMNKKWMKSQSVKMALVGNPKTPLGLTMQLLPQLGANEIRRIAKDRNTSAALKQQAVRLLAKMS